MEDPDYVIKIMVIWITIDEVEGTKTIRDFIDSSVTKERNQFTYQCQFGITFRYRNQVDNHNN